MSYTLTLVTSVDIYVRSKYKDSLLAELREAGLNITRCFLLYPHGDLWKIKGHVAEADFYDLDVDLVSQPYFGGAWMMRG